ncbi:MAG: NAD(P)/FAD-dependent oxidoreductase, partial [Turicibacter sp.]
FSALILAEMGYNPIVFERGGSVEDRVKSVQDFWKDGILDPNSNVQFGEGGAGTFSDGKLTTRVKDLRGRKVLEALVEAGAPEDILYTAHPHIGTDLLREVVKNIREKIISLGGEIHFNTTVTDFMIEEGQIKGIKIKGGDTIETEHVIIAIGHSARDSFYKLHERGVTFSQKAFAVGARIEHPQAIVNKAQYKEFANHPKLGAADYRFAHTASNGRGVYTFCMCPGGTVVPSSSEKGRLVTNGMSENARKEANANSGLLVQIYPSDFESDHPLAGIEFQRRLEEKAFGLGGSDYTAPAQLVGDFMKGQASKTLGTVKPSYARGVKLTNLNKLLPDYVITAMQEGIKIFDNKMRGFGMKDAILTGVETRSSSPVRMDRDSDTCQSVDVKGVYPAGEGAGYAGGIVSAGIDGIKCAEAIIRQYKK